MKVKETVGAIGFVAFAGAATVGLAVAGVIQAAAAGIELLLLAPFAHTKKTIRVPQPIVLAPREEPTEVRTPLAA